MMRTRRICLMGMKMIYLRATSMISTAMITMMISRGFLNRKLLSRFQGELVMINLSSTKLKKDPPSTKPKGTTTTKMFRT